MTKSPHASARDLAWAVAQRAKRVGEQSAKVRGADWRTAIVTAVGTDGTVTADGLKWRRMDTYQAPLVGDVIAVSQSSSGSLLAWGRTAGAGDPVGAWTAIPLASGFTSTHTVFGPAQYRILTAYGGTRVELRGSVDCTSSVTAQTAWSSALPAAARPSVARTFLGRRNYSTDTKGVAVLEMATSGVMNVFGSASPSQTDWFALDGCHYDL
ncbi:hypothetical protein ABZZ74_23200 [Streptomyces sp. NPDC006476]|uniref:hypothetical protein n=1 Tax=Streptomyces sp. NPDC006476 TaxID=3157175 RepID=UPI0033A7076F